MLWPGVGERTATHYVTWWLMERDAAAAAAAAAAEVTDEDHEDNEIARPRPEPLRLGCEVCRVEEFQRLRRLKLRAFDSPPLAPE